MADYRKRFLEKRILSDGSSSEYIHLKGTALDHDFQDFLHQKLLLLLDADIQEMEAMLIDTGYKVMKAPVRDEDINGYNSALTTLIQKKKDLRKLLDNK